MRIKILGLIALLTLLLLTGTVLARFAPAYGLDWYVPFTGAGGHVASTNYGVDFTIGQSVVGSASSTNYELGLGFWPGVVAGAAPGPTPTLTIVPGLTPRLYIPVLLKNFTTP